MHSIKIPNTEDVEIEVEVKVEVKLERPLDLGFHPRLASIKAIVAAS